MRKSHLIFALIGGVLFAWVIARMGVPAITHVLRAMRLALPIVLVLSACRLALQSLTWAASLKGEEIHIHAERLAAVRLASQSIGYLTVLGPVVSEPMKIKLLGTSTEPTITATFLDDGVCWFSSLLFAIAGIACLCFVGVHGAGYHLSPTILALALTLFAIKRRDPILSGVVRALGTRVPSWLSHAEKIEASIRAYRLEQPALVSRIFWINLACQALVTSEVVVILWSLHLQIHFFAVLAIDGVTRMLKLVSGWIPARLGSDEGGAISAFALTGFSPALGLALALTRRVRDLLWALLGILWLAWNFHSLSAQLAVTPGHSGNLPERRR